MPRSSPSRQPAVVNPYNRSRYWADPERHRAYSNRCGDKLRALARSALGEKCVACGEMGPSGFLDVDHINNDGAKEKVRGTSVWLIAGRCVRDQGAEVARQKYQLLCPNCHRLKTLAEKRGEL